MESIPQEKFPIFSGRLNNIGGYRHTMRLALPLILSSAGMAIQQFVDRVFLAWYSAEAIAATMSAGILHFTVMNLFIMTAGFTGTFVAQYYGAKQNKRIGHIIWQGLYIAIIAWIVHILLIPMAAPFFSLVGHSPEVQGLEIIYFQIGCLGAGPNVAVAVLSGFFTGRGRTRPVMTITLIGNVINVFLNYLLIFGHWGLPEMGVKGAAIATLIAYSITFIIFLFITFRRKNEDQFCIISGWKFDAPHFLRLLRFGLPNGVQFFITLIGFSFFVLMIGRLGTIELAATSITMNIFMLAFMPMTGIGMAVMVLVGQNQGRERPDLSQYSVFSGLHLTLIYMVSLAAAYILAPDFFLWPFMLKGDPANFVRIKEISIVLLRFVALYSIFDAMNIVFASGIKGAGDTKFVLKVISTLSIFVFWIPAYLVLNVFGLGIYSAWAVFSVYIMVLSVAFLLRFLSGKWKFIRVIEVAGRETPGSVQAE